MFCISSGIIGEDIVKRNNNDPNLTPDGLLTVEAQLQKIQELDEQLNKERPTGIDNLIKLRCVVMNIMGLSPLSDTRFMKESIKRVYIRTRDTYIIDLTQSKLDEDFGRICHETIFENGEDVSKYPIWTSKYNNVNSTKIAKNGLNLPSAVGLSENDIKRVCKEINSLI